MTRNFLYWISVVNMHNDLKQGNYLWITTCATFNWIVESYTEINTSSQLTSGGRQDLVNRRPALSCCFLRSWACPSSCFESKPDRVVPNHSLDGMCSNDVYFSSSSCQVSCCITTALAGRPCIVTVSSEDVSTQYDPWLRTSRTSFKLFN